MKQTLSTSVKNSFTLIELMVVVAIIIFLSSLAIPRYFKYFSKAKQTEAAIMLASLHTAQKIYWAEHNKYTKKLSGPNSLDWEPSGYNGGGKNAKFYYTYGFYFESAKEGINYFTGKLKTDPKNLSGTYSGKNKFKAKAAGNLNNNKKNKKIDIWSVDESRNIKHVNNGA